MPAGQREGLERVCRYALRPPVAQERLSLTGGGQVLLQFRQPWRDGTTHLVFDPVEFLGRLAVRVPRPRINLILYHGVLAWRSAVVRRKTSEGGGAAGLTEAPTAQAREADTPGERENVGAGLRTGLPLTADTPLMFPIVEAAPSTATYLVDRSGRVKVSFFGRRSLGRVGEVSVCGDNGVHVASLLDLAAQKVRVVQVRAERKDYLDLMTLLAHGISVPAALGAAQALYADFAPLVTLKALSYFDDGDLGALPDAVRQTLSDAAAAVHTPTPVARMSDRLI